MISLLIRRLYNEDFVAPGPNSLDLDIDTSVATVLVNSVCLLITSASLAFIFR